jgi:glucose-1-phosphate thymidylyltransferase
MKGIVLAGGAGSRLHPATRVASKQLQPVYDKPMIYYPLATLMSSGIHEILVISTPTDTPRFEALLGDGSDLGISISYQIQPEPKGIAQAFLVGEEFVGDSSVALILGDNIFYGFDFGPQIQNFDGGALIFGYPVTDPRRYGVAETDPSGHVVSLEEKPENPKSNLAVPGFYVYDNTVVGRVRDQVPSGRGELEITDLNIDYMKSGALRCELMGRGVAWLDSGTHDSLLEAANFIATIEHRQGLKIACLEEVALQQGFIDTESLRRIADAMPMSSYRAYIEDVVLG